MRKILLFIAIFFLIISNVAQVKGAEWGTDLVLPDGIPNDISPVQVAILDTGIGDHSDLNNNIKWTYDLTGTGANVDNVGHGSLVSGVVVQVNPSVEIYMIKILDALEGSFNFKTALDVAVAGPDRTYGTKDDADVINLSFGDIEKTEGMEAILKDAFDRDIVLVAAGGNDGDGNPSTDELEWPANSEWVIGVGATTPSNNLWQQSSSGPHIEMCAPGDQVRSTMPGDTYGTYSGTSLSAPFVTGVVSLYIAEHGRLPVGSKDSTDTNTIRGILHTSAIDLGSEGWDPEFGYGLVQYQSGLTVLNINDWIPIIVLLLLSLTVAFFWYRKRIKKIKLWEIIKLPKIKIF